jgi:hypothetical protein
MAQTKKKRRRKHRGTQGGRIDTRPARGRARSRAEAKAQARTRTKKKGGPAVPKPPSWSSAIKKGGLAAAIFLVVLSVVGQDPVQSLLAAVALGLAFYVPMAYLLDRFMYQRYLRKEEKKRQEREAQRHGVREAEG